MPDEALRAKVVDTLEKSMALERVWGRPVTAEQLQSEMNRMAAGTRDGELLKELFAALDNDPNIIAETLARATLVERLIRNYYATDDQLHGALRARVESAAAACRSSEDLKAIVGSYREMRWRLASEDRTDVADDPSVVMLDRDEWTSKTSPWRRATMVASVEETPDAFNRQHG
jgi:hypothetical protein